MNKRTEYIVNCENKQVPTMDFIMEMNMSQSKVIGKIKAITKFTLILSIINFILIVFMITILKLL